MIVSEILAEVAKGNFSVISHLSEDELDKCETHINERQRLIDLAVKQRRYVPSVIDGAMEVAANLIVQEFNWRSEELRRPA